MRTLLCAVSIHPDPLLLWTECLTPPNSFIKALTPNVMVFGGGVFEMWLGHEGGVLMNRIQFSHSVMSNSLGPHGLKHARLPCPSPTPKAAQTHVHWVSDAIQPSHPVAPFSCLQSVPASVSFPMSQFFASGGQRIKVSASASVLLMNTRD